MIASLDEDRLAEALWHVTAERGFIDLGGLDLAFGGKAPFQELAKEIAAAYASRGTDGGTEALLDPEPSVE